MLLSISLFLLAYCRLALANTSVSFYSLFITLAAADAFEYQTLRSPCDEYTSKSRRSNGQHCYLFTKTVLVCGVKNRRDGLYQMNT